MKVAKWLPQNTCVIQQLKSSDGDFPGGPVVKTSPSDTGGVSSIPAGGAKMPCASQPINQNTKEKQYCNKFNKDFLMALRKVKKTLLKITYKMSSSGLIILLIPKRKRSSSECINDTKKSQM